MDPKRSYLMDELWILSWAASVQRAKLFRKGTSEDQRKRFRIRIRSHLENDILPQYLERVSEEQHEKNIENLTLYGTSVGDGVLESNGYRIGVAQKVLNLHLKYLWCLGIIFEPPHCPVDRIVINQTKLREKVAWTRIATIADYRKVIAAIQETASREGLSLAEWELLSYKRPVSTRL